MLPRDTGYLLDMFEAARVVLTVTQGRAPDDLDSDVMLQSTVYWQVCVLGEAANQLSADFREEHPDTPWHEVVGIRNRLIHGYREIKNEIVWNVIQMRLPPLIAFLSQFVTLEDPDTT